MNAWGVPAAFARMLFFAVDDTIAKPVSSLLGNYRTSIIVVGFGLVPSILILVYLAAYEFTYQSLLLSVAGGIFFGLGYVLIYKSLETEQATNTIALFAITPLALLLFGTLGLKESFSVVDVVSTAMILIGAFLVTTNRELKFDKAFIPALLGNLAWSAWVIMATYAVSISNNFILPVTIGRVVGLVCVILVYFLFKKGKKAKIARKARGQRLLLMGMVAGLLDGLGTTSLGLLAILNAVAIGGAIGALGSGVVAVLSRIFYKDRLTKPQLIGVIIMILGAAALSLA